MRAGSAHGPRLAIEILAIRPTSQDGRIYADFGSTVQAEVRHLALLRGTGRIERFALGSCGVISRDAAVVEYHVDHPHLSRFHAHLTVDGERVVLAVLGNSNGMYVNGQRLTRLTLRRSNTDDSVGLAQRDSVGSTEAASKDARGSTPFYTLVPLDS